MSAQSWSEAHTCVLMKAQGTYYLVVNLPVKSFGSMTCDECRYRQGNLEIVMN